MSDDLYFACPTIGTKVYMAKGPAGWLETFKRADLDHELTAFIAPAPLASLVELFVATRELGRGRERRTDWHTIVGFLARTMGGTPKLVPHTVGIAFWAHVVLATTAAHGAN